MADSRKALSARARARKARADLAARKREQDKLVEAHQIAYFEADNEVHAFDRKIDDLRERIAQLERERDEATAPARHRQTLAMGALVVEAGQQPADVALLLEVSEAEVKRAATTYRQHVKATTPLPTGTASAKQDATAEAGTETATEAETEPQREAS